MTPLYLTMPRDRDGFVDAATSAYQAGRFSESEGLCRRVLAADPKNSQAIVLLGLNAAKNGRLSEAICHLKQGIELSPDSYDAAVWLCNLSRMSGKLDEAESFGLRAVIIKPNEAAGHAALGLARLAQGKTKAGVDDFTRAAALDPQSPVVMHGLGRALHASGKAQEACEAFRRAIALAPDRPESHIALGQALYETGDRQGAVDCFRRAYNLEPNTPRGLTQLSKALIEENDIPAARKTLERVLQLDPKAASAYGLLGNVLQQAGNFEAAAAKLSIAIDLQPHLARPYFDLFYCRTATERDRPIMDRIRSLSEDRRAPPDDRRHLEYALGKAHADLREFGPAMEHYDQANAIMLRLCRDPIDAPAFTAGVDAILEVFRKDLLAQAWPEASTSEMPVFIVGMIRSGTTLVEQIVSSHPDVSAGGELRFWQDRSHEAFNHIQRALDLASLARLAADYEGLVKSFCFDSLTQRSPRENSFAAEHSEHVTDKMPLNFIHLGLIHLAFPKARIIHCRRDPLDNALSIYLTPFPSPVNFAHRKDNIVFFYREYLRLMAHWRSVLPHDRFLEVDYESIVADRDGHARRMIQFLGLAWDDRCLRPEENRRIVRTPSMWQVRQPVYKSSVGRWHDYDPWLGPLAELRSDRSQGG